MTHSELVEAGRKWLAARCPVVLTEIATCIRETPDVFGLGYQNSALTVIIEAKASHADFLADKTKSFRHYPENSLGDLRFYLATPGIIAKDELPFGWGLLEARKTVRGSGVRMTMTAYQQEKKATSAELLVITSAFRRLKIPAGNHVSVRVYQWAQEKPRTTLTVKPEHRWSVRELRAKADLGAYDDDVWKFLGAVEEAENEMENAGGGKAVPGDGQATAVGCKARGPDDGEGKEET